MSFKSLKSINALEFCFYSFVFLIQLCPLVVTVANGSKILYPLFKYILSKFICRSGCWRKNNFPLETMLQIIADITRYPTKTHSGPASLNLNPPSPSSTAFLAAKTNKSSQCHHHQYSATITTRSRKKREGVMLWSNPVVPLFIDFCPETPHLFWDLQRSEPPGRKLKGPLCLSESLDKY